MEVGGEYSIPWDDLDEKIKPTVKAFNRLSKHSHLNFWTTASCQGGKGHPFDCPQGEEEEDSE